MSSARRACNSNLGCWNYKVLEESAGATSSTLNICKVVTLVEVSTMRPNQKVTDVGTVLLVKQPAKRVMLRRKDEPACVKDDCNFRKTAQGQRLSTFGIAGRASQKLLMVKAIVSKTLS